MARFFVNFVIAAAMLSAGCDMFAPQNEVSGIVVDAITGDVLADIYVEVGRYEVDFCRLLTGKPCGGTPFKSARSGKTKSDGSFVLAYSTGAANTIRVQPCEGGNVQECLYYAISIEIPPSGEITIGLNRRENSRNTPDDLIQQWVEAGEHLPPFFYGIRGN